MCWPRRCAAGLFPAPACALRLAAGGTGGPRCCYIQPRAANDSIEELAIGSCHADVNSARASNPDEKLQNPALLLHGDCYETRRGAIYAGSLDKRFSEVARP